jgi:hypothetical protein
MAVPILDPRYDPGRTTADPDMADWAYQQKLLRIVSNRGLSVQQMQCQKGAMFPCPIKALSNDSTWFVDSADAPLRFGMQFDSLRPRLQISLHLWPQATNGESWKDHPFLQPSQRVSVEFSAYDERDHGSAPFADRVSHPFDTPTLPTGRFHFCR